MPSGARSWRDAASTVAFALALTAVMGAALFVTVGVNPKADAYSNLPWYYAGGSAVAAAVFYQLSRRLDRPAAAVVSKELEPPAERSIVAGPPAP